MTKTFFRDHLSRNAFTDLFIEAGWNNPTTRMPEQIVIGPEGAKRTFTFREVAFLHVRVYLCEVEGALPNTTERNALDVRLRKNGSSYIAIYVPKGNPAHHLWVVPTQQVDRRHLVRVEYTAPEQTDFLYEKFRRLTFSIDRTLGAIELIDTLNAAFTLNAAEVTKKFYQTFKKHHAEFVKELLDLLPKNEAEWYASVMLNRLMFCYFIQKKGFLNLDPDYLRNHLDAVKAERGKDKFYGTFYKHFLRRLFADGLNAKTHAPDFEEEFGQIPYLNGGMFELHRIERDHPTLDLPDALFERLFDFFDDWRWHLDTSISSDGRDINPDVLGYIFEQYINDRAQMGAYYTKEDITEYIGRNTILPWLLEETAKASPAAFRPNGFVWQTLRADPERFIFPAVRKGCDEPLPAAIARGLDPEAPDLPQRRADWNKPTDDALALPTEIWRETIARRQRHAALRDAIAAGDIISVNDLITHNLDIRSFAQALLDETDDHLFISHFFKALTRITILDPTCGSGAFLFAALNILEPLYETCLARMEEWSDRFKNELATLHRDYRGNIRHYIYKTIILNNLYGVDIMHEAIEIARLRLFLKIVAAVDVDVNDPNLGLDPLPDIDFNIRCGNTLVGYANERTVREDLKDESGLGLDLDDYNAVTRQAADIAQLYARFKELQASGQTDADYHTCKREIQDKLDALNKTFNETYAKLHDNVNPGSSAYPKRLAEWKAKTRPFHWFADFYDIVIDHGGFDIIIGNPPYVKASKVKDYTIPTSYATLPCGNLYAYVLERCLSLLAPGAKYGFIIPISSVSNPTFTTLQSLFLQKTLTWFSSYSNRPGKLFEGVEQRLTICIGREASNSNATYYSSEYQHWYKEERSFLFSRLSYSKHVHNTSCSCLYKIGLPISNSIIDKLMGHATQPFVSILDKDGMYVSFHDSPTYFIRAMSFIPNTGNGLKDSSHYKKLSVQRKSQGFITTLLNSSLFYWFYKVISNCRDFSEREIYRFPLLAVRFSEFDAKESKLHASYMQNKEIKKRVYSSGDVYYEEYYPARSKPIIDEIDTLLATYYGFTAEELDFIINYDIKYRLGDTLNDND